MKLLLTDATNDLGQALQHDLERESFALLSPSAQVLDWLDEPAITHYIAEQQPAVVLNTLGVGEDSVQADGALAQAAANLARACAAAGIPLIQLSSYRVFGDRKRSVHHERDEPEPASAQGHAWRAAELAVLKAHERAVVLRYSWLVAGYGDNLLTRHLRAFAAGEPVTVSRRWRGAPTALSDASRVAIALAKQVVCGAENWGVMHYCTGDAVSEAEFVAELVQLLEQQGLLSQPAHVEETDELPDGEPVSAVLGCRRAKDHYGVQARSWRPTLLPMVKLWVSAQ
ncbi:sugar nucleotide-binding protein [Marinimicrobium alkaliphilum]|uniref:sugar nucleotide-binding protein n=1 Tax=Marinimicrobium alkaliphilum TaxID=2202654 RepID=UPI0013004EE0|nr:sugar nucleotide-binding protein [Marinimicrobium alkaliphilum]